MPSWRSGTESVDEATGFCQMLDMKDPFDSRRRNVQGTLPCMT